MSGRIHSLLTANLDLLALDWHSMGGRQQRRSFNFCSPWGIAAAENRHRRQASWLLGNDYCPPILPSGFLEIQVQQATAKRIADYSQRGLLTGDETSCFHSAHPIGNR